ncbi:hypothetical protein BKE38_05015 [Pseudoroseomonas deserti]|uniref:Uncharacterized protein n=1 Tax=Teichococcus deserti TaxID=1817963 RepID=A0A1V2H754_9PROT|nr:hypothetical protein [Pseudoroseomonas deserti]ONG56956.1 hypothetical protein BKE38_05015 [Pseudoroseomonas deserti]
MAPLIAAALGLAPVLVEMLAGKKAGGLVEAAAEAIAGTTDAEVIRNLPPDQQAQLRQELARIALEVRRAELADVQHARDTATKSNLVAWAQVTGAAVILGIWGVMALRLAFTGLPSGNEVVFSSVFAGVSGVLGAVQQFFFGNSTASHAANQRLDAIAASAPMLSLPAPQASIPTPSTDDLNGRSLAAARGMR